MLISRLVFIASLVTCIRSYAGTTITGRVTDAYGECVPDASLYLKESGSNFIIEYCETDTHGEYTLKYSGSSDSLTLVLSGFGIKTQTCNIANCSQTVNFVTSVIAIDIKEVTVVADRVTQHGDTLSYIVEAFKLPTDRTIGDVIKNMPGLQVDDSGRISFNGKEISNFYVENLDLLEGRYGIGTNNIHASDIASVQIYQNHKPIKALSDWDYDQKVAVNLTLKPNRRGTFNIDGMASAGAVPFLWGGELTAMYFTKLFQTISLYKGNNTGEDSTKELKDYKNTELAPLPPASLQLVQPIPPDIPAKRYIQNKTHVANTNNIIKIDSVTTLDVAVSYENSIFGKADEYIEKRLVEGAETREIAQNMTTESHTDRLSIFGTYKTNSASLYLVNNFSAKSVWDRGNGIMSFPDNNNAQKLLQRINDKTSVSINDNFNFVHSQGDRKWEVNIRAGYARRPQTLSVEPSNMLGVGDESSNIISQRFIREVFRIAASSFYSYRAGIFVFSGSLYGRADVESVKSDLDGTIFASNNAKNDFRFNSYMLEGQLSGVANLSRFWRLSLTLPLLLEFQANKNNIDKASHFRTDLRVNPLFKIIFTPDLNQNVSLTGVYNSYKDFSNFFENGIVMHSYLDFSSREPYTWSGYHQYEARTECSYRNTMYEFFGDTNASFVHTKRNTLDYITYNGIVTETRLMQKKQQLQPGKYRAQPEQRSQCYQIGA